MTDAILNQSDHALADREDAHIVLQPQEEHCTQSTSISPALNTTQYRVHTASIQCGWFQLNTGSMCVPLLFKIH